MELITYHIDPSDSNSTTTNSGGDANQDRRQRICSGCDRPTSVCLCDRIPVEPISTINTQIVILHHPHEQRHKLTTVPVLAKCLKNYQTLIGRRIRYGDSPLLDSLHDSLNPSKNVGFLFPGTDTMPSMEINQWKSSIRDAGVNNYVLIDFDVTWKHAKEMVNASFPFLSKFATLVCLTYDVGVDGGTIFNSDLILRKEQFSGCTSTMEAVARCLRVLEPMGLKLSQG